MQSGCAGGKDSAHPTGPDAGLRVATVVITPLADSVRVYDRVRMTATVFGVNGSRLDSAVVWSAEPSPTGSLSAEGELEGLMPGVLKVTARSGAVSSTATVAIAPAAVASLEVSPRQLLIGTGRRFPLTVVARDSRGAPATQSVELLPSSAGVATEGLTLRGQQAGSLKVFVRVGDKLDSVSVAVIDGVPFTMTATSISPGATISLYGDALSGASVAIAGTNAAVLAAADTMVRFAVPGLPFEPCRPEGPIELAIQRPSGTTRTSVPAESGPLTLTLAPGAHAFMSEAVARGCDVAVTNAGDYLVMPYAWDRATGGYYVGAGPLAARLSVLDPAGQGSSASLATASTFSRATQSSLSLRSRASIDAGSNANMSQGDGLVGDVLDLSDRASATLPAEPARFEAPTAGVSCPIPLTVGSTIPVGTERSGGIVQLALRGSPTENWTLVAITPKLAVFYDSSLVRVVGTDATMAARLQRFVAAYDSTVIPLLETYTNGIPDADANGRVVLLMPYKPTGGFAYAMPNGYGRPDCTYGEAGGEAFFMPSNYVVTNPAVNLPTALALAAHETAHLVDLKGTLADREYTAWSSEGFAMQFNWLWSAGPGITDPYSGNRPYAYTRVVEGAGTGYSCVEPLRSTWAGVYSIGGVGGGSYTGACAMVRAVIVRGVARGLTVRQALMRFVALQHRYTLTSTMNEYEGTSRPAPEVVGEWLLMWYADDQVSGTSPALQDPAVQWKSAYFGAWPLPEQTLRPGDQLDLSITEPDVHHYLATLPARGRVRLIQPNGYTAALTARASLALLRVR